MKFKYIGELPIKDVDLVLAGAFKPNDIITKDTIFEIPDENALAIQRTKLNGNYEVYTPPKRVVKPKKKYKKEEEEEEI